MAFKTRLPVLALVAACFLLVVGCTQDSAEKKAVSTTAKTSAIDSTQPPRAVDTGSPPIPPEVAGNEQQDDAPPSPPSGRQDTVAATSPNDLPFEIDDGSAPPLAPS